MRISDWSSDVCSSDLGAQRLLVQRIARPIADHRKMPTLDQTPVEQAQIAFGKGIVTVQGDDVLVGLPRRKQITLRPQRIGTAMQRRQVLGCQRQRAIKTRRGVSRAVPSRIPPTHPKGRAACRESGSTYI